MRETMACIDVGQALGYVGAVEESLVDRMRRIVGTLVRLACR
jgi:hypothetical protein